MSGEETGGTPRPDRESRDVGIDDALQRELDEALSEMSLESLIDTDIPQRQASAEGVRRGEVIAIHGSDIFVDLGGRSQGLLQADQFRDKPIPAVGDLVEVTVEGYDPDDGLLLLSREGAVQAATWASLNEGQIVEGRVTGHNKGGLEMDLSGIKAFMPISQVETFRVEELAPYVNQKLRCEVVEVRRDEKSVVVSRRAVMAREEEEARRKAFEDLHEGQVVRGLVKTIMPYGAFVDIGGFDGLLHIGDMRHSRVEDPHDVVKEGQTIEVMVLKIDREERKIGLGLKQVLPDPWAGAAEKWAPDTIVTGRITKLADFGAFIELEEGVEGLIPISEMSFERHIHHPREVVGEGDLVKVRVLNVDPDARRISLSIKRLGDDPWVGASVRWPVDSVVEGTVTRITDFGAFVELTPGVEGLVHISELSDSHVRMVSEVVRERETVQAKVVDVDEERRRIGLSIKAVKAMPDYTGTSGEQPEPARPKKKRKKPLKGGLEW